MERVRAYIRERVSAEDRGHATPCWIWQRFLTAKGYAYAWVPGYGRNVRVHRAAFEEYVGPIGEGLQIDHLCRQRDCVNPAHLEAVTSRENTVRGVGPTAQMASKTHCASGHELAGSNLIIRAEGGRRCRICANLATRRCRESVAAPHANPMRGSGHERGSAACEDRTRHGEAPTA